MNHDHKIRGFTLVELMLAMGFVSALLLAIAMTVIQIGNIYNRGITYKNVTQAGSLIVSELKRGIANSTPFDVPPGVGDPSEGPNYVKQTGGGRLCTGQNSYIWNDGKAIFNYVNDPHTPLVNLYDGSPSKIIRFVKVADTTSKYCKKKDDGTYLSIPDDSAAELLGAGQLDLAIQSFVITSPAHESDSVVGQRLYSIEFVLGTNDQAALLTTADDTTCRPPSDSGSNLLYCAINRFNLVVRAGNATE